VSDEGTLTFSGLPLPMSVPPQLPVNQSTVSPGPTVAVRFSPTCWKLKSTPVGVLGSGWTVTTMLTQALTMLVPETSVRTKYVVVAVGLTVGEAPPATGVVPQPSVNHSTLSPSAPGVAESVVDWPWQMAVSEAVGGEGKPVTFTSTLQRSLRPASLVTSNR